MKQCGLTRAMSNGCLVLLVVSMTLVFILGPTLAFLTPPSAALPLELSDQMKLTLDFGAQVLNYSGPAVLRLWINATDPSSQPVSFAYFGTWQTQSYLGIERGGQLAREGFAGNATEEIRVDSFKPKIGLIFVTLGAYTVDARWAVNQTFIILERTDVSIGTFTVNLEAQPGVSTLGLGFVVTSYSYLTLSGADVANATILYFSGEGQLTPPLGFSDDDGHDRVFFAPFPCSEQTATIFALALHLDYGITLAWITVPAGGSECRRPEAVAAYVMATERENATAVRAAVRIVVRLPPPTDERNVSLLVIPELGLIDAVQYRGNISEDHTWIAGWLTDIPIRPSRFAILGTVGSSVFTWVFQLANDVGGPDTFHQPASTSLIGEPIPVTVFAADPSGIWFVQLRYKVDGGSYSAPLELTPSGEGSYSGSIPAQNAGIVCYYVEAVDFWGNPTKTPPTDCHPVDIGLASQPPPEPFASLPALILIGALGFLSALLVVLLLRERRKGRREVTIPAPSPEMVRLDTSEEDEYQ